MALAAAPDLDQKAFRDVLGMFATGVAIIAPDCVGEIRAMTVNSVCSLSLDPMLVLFCPSKRCTLARYLPDIKHFSINFLRSEQESLSTYFAGGQQDPVPPFRFVPWQGAPRLEGSLAALCCETHRVVEAGDHWVVIGRVVAIHRGIEPHHPLLFFRGAYRRIDFSESHPAPDLNTPDEPPHVFYDH
jgi:flavin reductase (DIM6/NTAB) family NADH-FMN oxidoreductase RutF